MRNVTCSCGRTVLYENYAEDAETCVFCEAPAVEYTRGGDA